MSTKPEPASQDNPFLGPDPLSQQQPVFGRDGDIAALRSLILAERVVVMHGVSGAGKSSVLKGYGGIRTGFLNERGFSVLGPIDLRVAITENVHDLYQRTLIEEIIRQNEIGGDSQGSGEELRDLFDLELLIMHFAREAGSSYQLLIIDQFEDIFSRLPYDEEGRRNFFEMLGGILERNEGLKVLLSMRDEYLGELDRFRRFIPGRLKATFRLELLGKQQAFDAITLTVDREPYNVRLCADEVRAMVDDLSNLGASDLGGNKLHAWESHFVEPLFLQLACRDAWPGILARSVKLKSSAGGDEDPCVPLEGSASAEELDAVLSRFYEETVDSRSGKTAEGDTLKLRLFVQDGLITPNGVRNLIGIEEVVARWGLSEAAIDTLVKAHLVRPQRRNRETFYELAHDRLLAPIKNCNEEWINGLPDWRKAARLWNRGGGSDRNLSLGQQINARLMAKRAPGSLAPYEKRFIEEKASRTRSFIARALVFLTVWALIGAASSYFANVKVRNVIANTKKELTVVLQENEAVLKENAIVLKDNEEKSEKLAKAELELEQNEIELKFRTSDLKLEQDLSKVQGLLGGYSQRKWVEQNDEAAILQVREAYDEAERRFGEDQIPPTLTGPFLAAFNNAMTPSFGSPGFSRTFPLGLVQEQAVAIHPGGNATIAYHDATQGCLVIRRLRERSGRLNCLHKSASPPVSLAFDARGRHLAVRYRQGLSVFDLGGFPESGGTLTPKVFEAGKAVDLFGFSGDGARIGYLSEGVVSVLCGNASWRLCARHTLPAGFGKATALAVSDSVNGKRRLAVARENGDVLLSRFDDMPGADPVAGFDPFPVIEEPGRLYPYFKDDRQVLYLGFTGGAQALLVVHRDTQVFLVRVDTGDNRLVKSLVVPKAAISSLQTRSEEGNKHFQAAVVSSDAKLFTVLEDEITRWDLSGIGMGTFSDARIGVGSTLWETGARNLTALYVDKDWLIGRGFFKLWLWERDSSLESKLITSQFPTADTSFSGDLLFYPQAISFGEDRELIVGTTLQGLMRWKTGPAEPAAWNEDELTLCQGFRNTSVRALALSSDRRMIAAAMGRQRLMVLPLSGDPKPLLCDAEHHQDGLWAVAFSHDGQWLASGDYAGKVHLWKITPDGLTHHAELPLNNQDPVRSIAFHPRLNLLAVGKWKPAQEGASGVVELLRLGDDGRPLDSQTLEFPEGGIGSILDLGFSNDGNSLVAAGSSGPMQLWGISTQGPPGVVSSRVLPGHAGGTRALAFNPSLNYLASGGADGLVRVWNLQDTGPVSVSANLKGIDADVLSLAWHKDGKQLAVSYKHASITDRSKADEHSHGVVALWDWDLSRLSEIVCETAWRPLNANEWSDWIEPVSGRPYAPACGMVAQQP